ncbi:MAG: hypothetical protein R6V61_12355 [Wenzhouxiangellaceae bacterium]
MKIVSRSNMLPPTLALIGVAPVLIATWLLRAPGTRPPLRSRR